MDYIFNKNKLKELLKSKTAFILGAGASSDYGFPLWHELKTKIENNLQHLPPLSDISHNDVEFWRKEINNAENKTIDDLLFEHDKRSSDYILQIINLIISECEAKNLQQLKTGWIDKLKESIIEIILDDISASSDFNDLIKAFNNVIKNFTVISLNYDRSFEYHFSKGFLSPLQSKLNLRDSAKQRLYNLIPSLTVYHPHGVIRDFAWDEFHNFCNLAISPHAYLFKNQSGPASFNHLNSPYGVLNQPHKIFISPVNELTNQDNTYKLSNSKLQECTNIICLGLSVDGINKSHFIFPKHCKYFLSNKQEDSQLLNKKIKSLDQSFLGMYCNPLFGL